MSTTFTIYHDGQHWVGILETVEDGYLRVARHVFGSEPTSPELLEFARHDFLDLADRRDRAAPSPVGSPAEISAKEKRAARDARKRGATPVSTITQDALKASISESKAQRKRKAAAARRAERDARRRTRKSS